jgi:hypothetical protein
MLTCRLPTEIWFAYLSLLALALLSQHLVGSRPAASAYLG